MIRGLVGASAIVLVGLSLPLGSSALAAGPPPPWPPYPPAPSQCSLTASGYCVRTDVSGTELIGRNLTSAYLIQSTFDGSNMAGATLNSATLRWASLERTILAGATMNGANLTSTSLVSSRMTGASLTGVSGAGAVMRGASIPLRGQYRHTPVSRVVAPIGSGLTHVLARPNAAQA